MRYEERHSLSGSRPFLSGHFPGDPVVPAVIILELVMETLRRWKGPVAVTGVPFAKFKAPLLPDVPFRVRLRDAGDRAIGFECRTDDLVFAEGKAEFRVSDRIGR